MFEAGKLEGLKAKATDLIHKASQLPCFPAFQRYFQCNDDIGPIKPKKFNWVSVVSCPLQAGLLLLFISFESEISSRTLFPPNH